MMAKGGGGVKPGREALKEVGPRPIMIRGGEGAMGFFDKLREAATRAANQVGDGAEKFARHVASHGPGFIGLGAAELLAERDYHRARELANDGLSPEIARQVVEMLAPHAEIDGTRIVLINRLLADSYLALEDEPRAKKHFERSLALLRDPLQKRDAEPQMVEELDLMPDVFEAQILTSLATIAINEDDVDGCMRYALQAIGADKDAHGAVYLQGMAMLRKGISHDAVAELFAKALSNTDPEQVLGWVRDLLPEHLAWFERLAR
jgi:tetratricopeptide (TPR) repeat protein